MRECAISNARWNWIHATSSPFSSSRLSYKPLRRYAEEIATVDRALSIKPDDAETKARALASLSSTGKLTLDPCTKQSMRFAPKTPEAIKSVADVWFICALAEHDAAAAEMALDGTGRRRRLAMIRRHFDADFGRGLLARMIKDESKAHSAFARIRPEQEKIVQAQPDYGSASLRPGVD